MVRQESGYSTAFLITVCIFITSLITANIISVKLINIFGLILPAGIIIFPISYIVGDILTEVYGYSTARKVIWLGFFCNLVLVIAVSTARILPPAPIWDAQDAYNRILGYTPRLLVASFMGYLVGEFSNSYVLAKMKIFTNGRLLWSRTIGSTIVGEGLDSLIFITIAFVGTVPTKILIITILTQWIVKSLYEALATPFTYICVNMLKSFENIDTYDYETNFNPLHIK